MKHRLKGQSEQTLDKSETEQKNIYLMAYGSLRHNEYNYQWMLDHYGKDCMIWLGERKISGWKMYDLGSYPAVVPALDEIYVEPKNLGSALLQRRKHRITVDVFQLTEDALHSIHDMETLAGYEVTMQDIPNLMVNGKPAKGLVYYMPDLETLVIGGDWVAYQEGRRAIRRGLYETTTAE